MERGRFERRRRAREADRGCKRSNVSAKRCVKWRGGPRGGGGGGPAIRGKTYVVRGEGFAGQGRTGKKRQRRGRWDVKKHEDYAAWSWRERRRKSRSQSCRRRSQRRRQLEGAPGGGRLRWRPCDGVSWHPGTILTFWFRWSDCCFRPSLQRVSACLFIVCSFNARVILYFSSRRTRFSSISLRFNERTIFGRELILDLRYRGEYKS